eukprot:g1289.t1
MAVQFHISHSEIVSGAGILCGGPFFCAQDNLEIALHACMKPLTPFSIDVDELVLITHNTYLTTGTIDNPKNLKQNTTKVWLFSGTKDTVVHSSVVEKTKEYYEKLGVADIQFVNNVSAQHAFPTTNTSMNSCSHLGSPYINDCNYDGAGELLNFLLQPYYPNGLHRPETGFDGTSLLKFDQTQFFPVARETSMEHVGYIYIPKKCLCDNSSDPGMESTLCCSDFHIVFHGCEQTLNDIGLSFITGSGYLEWAESNGIITIFPQAKSSLLNPKGCWDWWGFTGPGYSSKIGIQVNVVYKILMHFLVSSKQ